MLRRMRLSWKLNFPLPKTMESLCYKSSVDRTTVIAYSITCSITFPTVLHGNI